MFAFQELNGGIADLYHGAVPFDHRLCFFRPELMPSDTIRTHIRAPFEAAAFIRNPEFTGT